MSIQEGAGALEAQKRKACSETLLSAEVGLFVHFVHNVHINTIEMELQL